MRHALRQLPLWIALMLAPAPAAQAASRYGTVAHAWISAAQHARAQQQVSASTPRLIASFVWLRAPTAGLPLQIVWLSPQGAVIAVWNSTSLASDRRGTRLWASITNTLFSSRPGIWHARLKVDDRLRSSVGFRVTG